MRVSARRRHRHRHRKVTPRVRSGLRHNTFETVRCQCVYNVCTLYTFVCLLLQDLVQSGSGGNPGSGQAIHEPLRPAPVQPHGVATPAARMERAIKKGDGVPTSPNWKSSSDNVPALCPPRPAAWPRRAARRKARGGKRDRKTSAEGSRQDDDPPGPALWDYALVQAPRVRAGGGDTRGWRARGHALAAGRDAPASGPVPCWPDDLAACLHTDPGDPPQ